MLVGLGPINIFNLNCYNFSISNSDPFIVCNIICSISDVFPTVFDGARVIFNKALSNNFQVTHNVNLSAQQPGSYRFGATFVGANQIGPGEFYPVLLGEMDASGLLSANIFHQFGSRLRLKFQAQVSFKFSFVFKMIYFDRINSH